MRKMVLDERKEIELEILKYVHNLCEKKHIEYSLCGGTLIGAVRHKGFIPWDDDIDIFLVRGEYNRLINELKKQDDYILYSPGYTKNYLYGFSKLVDKRTKIIGKYDTMIGTLELGIFIDIYPIDTIPQDKNERKKFIKSVRRSVWCAYMASPKAYYYSTNFFKSSIKKVLYYPLHKLYEQKGKEYWMRLAENRAQKYANTGEMVMGSLYSRYGEKEVLPRKVYKETEEVVFENIKVKIIKEYDSFLKSVYGDYMKLPPKEKQILPHDYDAYWRE